MPLPLPENFSSRKEWKKFCWREIKKSGELLDLLVTPYERENIIIRAAVLELLNLGMGVREISRKLSVSRQTINAIKKANKEKNYKSYRARSKTERKKKVYSENFSQNKKPTETNRGYRRTKYGKVPFP